MFLFVLVDVDECFPDQISTEYKHLAHNCHVDANCTNTKGSFYCMCNTGYSGDGVTCIGTRDFCSGVRFSKDQKASRTQKRTRKAPEKYFGCFSKHLKYFEPGKYVIFPRKLHGYSLPPAKRFRVCFSCTHLLNKMASAYILLRAK